MTGQSIWRISFIFWRSDTLAYLLVGRGAALSLTIFLFCVLSVVGVPADHRSSQGGDGREVSQREGTEKAHGQHLLRGRALVTILLFRKEVAVCALLVLAISDPLSSLVGRRLGRHPLFGKSIEGTLAFLGSSLIILMLFSVSPSSALPWHSLHSDRAVYASFPGR